MAPKLTGVMLRDYPDLMVAADIQRLLNIGRTKTYDLLKNGDIRSLRIGSGYRVPKAFLVDYLNSIA
jgi:excisionase family DNA binding protein